MLPSIILFFQRTLSTDRLSVLRKDIFRGHIKITLSYHVAVIASLKER